MVTSALSLVIALVPSGPVDSDGDGVSDEVEVRSGSDPYDKDSDDDGVPDGVEDRDRDGVVDPGESDPRRPGLFPGTGPHIPEPLSFDLVRGLGARQGELEVNVLVEGRVGFEPHVEWAPEVEWAFVDGHAIELELPLVDERLKAVKMAVQGTLPPASPYWAHGWQVIGEVAVSGDAGEIAPLYIVGGRVVPKFSMLLIAGGRIELDTENAPGVVALLNPSLFVDPHEALTLGLETNIELGPGGAAVDILPQAHVQLSERFRLQIGSGVSYSYGSWGGLLSFRAILE